MMQLRLGWLRLMIPCVGILASLVFGSAVAQEGQACQSERSEHATLRLEQVVTRAKDINFYAIAQDWSGKPTWPCSPHLEALVGSNRIPVEDLGKARNGIANADGIAFVFLVDVSGSLGPQQFEAVRKSLEIWIEGLRTNDLAAIVTFGSEVKISRPKDQPTTAFFSDLGILKQLIPLRPGRGDPNTKYTKLYQGLVQAIDLARRPDLGPFRRAIVVLTDGLDDQQGGAGRQEVLDKLNVDSVPIYGIGAATAKKNPAVDQALKDFSALVRVSGGDYVRIETNVDNISRAYSNLNNIVNNVMHLHGKCERCTVDGSAVQVRLTMSGPAETLDSQTVTVRLRNAEGGIPVPPPLEPTPTPKQQPLPTQLSPKQPPIQEDTWWSIVFRFILDVKTPLLWAIGLAVLASVGIAGTLAMLKKRRIETRSPPVVTRPPGAPPRTTSGDVAVLSALVVTPATSPHTQRLRLYPLGQNDLAPIDVQFERKLLVGRSPESEICIGNDGQVSAKHCTLAPDGKFILVQDNQSRNGTRINGVPINGSMHAEPDAILGIGRTDLRIRLLPAGVR